MVFDGWRLNGKCGLWMFLDATYTGAFQGGFFFTDFQAVGTTTYRPLRISVLAGTTGVSTEIRGLHFDSTQIYGSGTLMEADGIADIGDIWFKAGSQWDGPTGEAAKGLGPAIQLNATNGGRIFNNHWVAPYIQNYDGPAMRCVTDATTSIIANQQFHGGNVTLMDNTGGGIFDLEGPGSGGLILDGVDFQNCKGQSYVVGVNADSIVMRGCISSDELVGKNNISSPVAIAGTVKRVTAIGNTLQSVNTGAFVTNGTPVLYNLGNNVLYT